jgi:hypothetical protein
MIADHFRHDHGELRYDNFNFNSFLKVNRALYASLNCTLWKEARKNTDSIRRVFTRLIKTNNLAQLEFFLELDPDVEVRLPDVGISGAKRVGFENHLMEPTPRLLAADLDHIPLARLLLEKGANAEYSDESRGRFGLMHATRSTEMVQLLLKYKADPNLADEMQRRPLHWHSIRAESSHEAAQRNLAAVELLVEHERSSLLPSGAGP